MNKPLDSQTKLPGIEIGNNQIVIHHKATPVTIRIVLIIILIICAVLPLIITPIVLFAAGPHFGLLLTFLFFWGFGFMILRVVLWNTYGREILSLRDTGIEYLADYKYFKDARKEIEIEGLRIEIIYEDDSNTPVGRLRMTNDTHAIETVLQSNLKDLETARKEIKKRYADPTNSHAHP